MKKWKAVTREEKKKYQYPILIFHGVEVLIVLFLLSLKWGIFLFVLIGFIFHFLLDQLDLIIRKELLLSKFSQIGLLFYNRGRKKFKYRS